MAPQIVLLMHFPVFRCNVSTNWLRKLPRPRTPSVHGQSSSWGIPQPLPKTRGCYINTADIPSRNQSTPSVLCSIYYPTLPSFTTYLTLFLLLYGSPGFLQNHQGISYWYSPWTPRERLWRSNQGWTTATAVHRYQEITRCSNSYSPTHYHHSPPNIEVTAPRRLSFLPSWETLALGCIYHGLLWVFESQWVYNSIPEVAACSEDWQRIRNLHWAV